MADVYSGRTLQQVLWSELRNSESFATEYGFHTVVITGEEFNGISFFFHLGIAMASGLPICAVIFQDAAMPPFTFRFDYAIFVGDDKELTDKINEVQQKVLASKSKAE